jgi:regulator of sigma E protease
MTLYGIFVFLVVFAILVFFHELGHFLAARSFRMRVEEFALGFGPGKLRLYYDGQTEYTIHPIPLGGFVKITGMELEDANDNATPVKDGFNSRPLYQRFIVILAGPLFSLLFGWLTLCLIGVTVGEPTKRDIVAAQVVNGSVAAAAGVRAGESLIALNGKRTANTQSAIEEIRNSPNKPLVMTLKSENGSTRDLTLTPREETEGGVKIGRIGVAFRELPDMKSPFRRMSLGESFQLGTEATGSWFQQMTRLVRSGEIKDNVSGPVAIFDTTQKVAEIGGLGPPMELLGSLSLSLGLANLLPIPVLDGGYLMLFALEAIRRRKLTPRQTERVMLGGLAVLATLFVVVTFRDITTRFFPSPSPTASATPPANR